jgi:hypothetical protein
MEGGNMIRESVWQYAAAKREAYLRADRKGKKGILDGFCETTGYHRKSAIDTLRRHPPKEYGKRRGWRKGNGEEVSTARRVAWKATDGISAHICPLFFVGAGPTAELSRLLGIVRADPRTVAMASALWLLTGYWRHHEPAGLRI